MKETIEIYGKAVNITMEPIGKPVNLRKKFKNILSKYHLADYDQIYLVSMSSCMTSIIDKKYFDRVCLITPFYLYTKPVCKLLKAAPKDFFGCHILILLNGRMGTFDKRIRLKLAELDNITDNKYFMKHFENIEVIKGVDHYLGEMGVLDIVKSDISKQISN
ncbi:hypothetical protein FLM55_01760 [Francisella sp. Scap27]|nr:hypothetical protein [Francisella sp. Scap27]QLE78533.1 hypothetical protein FLM55_01760 [Francisella sp. Scap27]